ncbi:uncharacterized protein LOC122276900 [Carya illinoinensis]|uniref:uncharacterized protein LOC122276900 n=1 Tax=Carya illinoinensis TaxID=32201 RepID=UPI001C71F6DA|nr:uncharacterized protein LOC122276900 [Carya illinoinensis]
MVRSPIKFLSFEATVAELIDHSTKSWKRDPVQEIFEEEKALVILQTPISSLNSKDKLIWHGTKNGSFSVKSAYHMEKATKMEGRGQASTSKSFKEVWKKIWQLHIPPIDKMFIWRACQESLPTQLNLFKTKIVKVPLCPICSREEESILHTLWNCEVVKDVWGQCSMRLQKSTCSQLPMVLFFENMIKVLNDSEMQEFVMVARQLWLRRNSFIFKNKFLPPNCLLRETSLRLQLLKEEEDKIQTQKKGQQTKNSAEKWQSPPAN